MSTTQHSCILINLAKIADDLFEVIITEKQSGDCNNLVARMQCTTPEAAISHTYDTLLEKGFLQPEDWSC